MKTHKLGRLFILLVLAALFLAACQPAALETASPPAAQPEEAGTETETPAPTPTETPVAVEQPAPAQPTEVAPTGVPSAEGDGLPPADMLVPEDWLVFNELFYDYFLAYPPEWNVCQRTKFSRSFCQPKKEPSEMGGLPRLYVSVFPQDSTNSDFEVYNYISNESIQKFMALPVGDATVKEPVAVFPEYITFTRLPDQVIDGTTALVIENSKVWEFPPETKDRLVIFVTDGTIYTIGMYYETPQELEMFEQVLESFQIIP